MRRAEDARRIADLESVAEDLREQLADERRAHAEPAEWLQRKVGARIVVHTTGDASIEGTLLEPIPVDGLHLRAAKVLGSQAKEDQALVGDVWVPRERVAFVQSLT